MIGAGAAYTRALSSIYRKNVKGHFLSLARKTVRTKLLGDPAKLLKHREVFSVLSPSTGGRSTDAGTIYGSYFAFSKQLQKDLGEVSIDFTKKIYNMSQKLVPIDKKYIGKISRSEIGVLQKPRSYLIPEKDFYFSGYDPDSKKSRADAKYELKTGSYYSKHFKELYLPKGTYYNNGLVKEFFLSSNKRKRRQLYVEDDGTIKSAYGGFLGRQKSFGKIDEIGPINPRSLRYTNEATGGNQELKKGGKIDKDQFGFVISYSSKRGGAKWEYAQLQHDNLAYKHAPGKQALYLYDSFEYYRKKYMEAVRNKTLDRFTKAFKPNYKKRRYAAFKIYGRKTSNYAKSKNTYLSKLKQNLS